MEVLILSGRKRSGKSTVAEYLVKNHRYHALALADSLKSIMADMLKLLYNDTFRTRERFDNPEFKDVKGYVVNNFPDNVNITKYPVKKELKVEQKRLSYRNILQFGADILRKNLYRDVFCHVLDIHIKELAGIGIKKVVISDVRQIDELEYFRSRYTVKSIRLERKFDLVDLHETERLEFSCDETIVNDGTRDELFAKVDKALLGSSNMLTF